MNDDLAEFGYTPQNLRIVLKLSGVTQILAAEMIGKARGTFIRYLHNTDNENHVSMSNRDWSLLLEKLNFPRQSFKLNRRHMNIQSSFNQKIEILESLSPTTEYFVGARDPKNGQIITHLTPGLTIEKFEELMKSEFQSEGVVTDGYERFSLEIQSFFITYAEGLVKKISDLNQVLFQRIIDYDTDGVITKFKAFFDRIIRSEYKDFEGLSSDLLRVNTHFMKEFLNTQGFYRNPAHNVNQRYSQKYLCEIDHVELSFSSALNTLVMYMVSEYFGDKSKYHLNNKHITDVIENMYEHLSKLVRIKFLHHENLFNEYLISIAFNNPAEFEYTQDVLEYKVTATDLARMIKGTLRKSNDCYEDGYFNTRGFEFNVIDSVEVNGYFQRLTKLFGILNLVCEMNSKLASCSRNGSTEDAKLKAESDLQILLKLPNTTTALTAQ